MIEMVVAIVEMVVGAVTHAASRTADGANMLAAVEMRSGIDADTAAAGDMTAAEAADTAATHVPAGEAAAAHMAAAAAEAAATLNEGQAARRLKRIREVGRRGDGRG
jgi:hypothetical protein